MDTLRRNLLRALALPGLLLALVVSEGWAVRPYTPVQPDPVLEPWRWRSFPELNGLGLQCMAEAKDKAMWFGVDDGVRRYDGVKWTAYTEKDGLLGAPVEALCATRDGSVYAGTGMGISRFKDGRWSRAFPPEGDLPWPIFELMEAKNGSLWAGTVRGALRLDKEGTTLYTTNQVGSALRTLAPSVRLSTVPDEACPSEPWPDGVGADTYLGWVLLLAPGGPAAAAGLKVGDRVLSVNGDSSSRSQMFGPPGAAVKLTVQRKDQARPFEVTLPRAKIAGTLRDCWIFDVFEDRAGAMWFGFYQGDIVRYKPSTRDSGPRALESGWQLYTEKDGLEIGDGPSISQTRDGTIWTVSDHGLKGVNRFDGKKWSHFRLSALNGSDTNTSILETRDETLWIGGYGALHALRGGTWQIYRSPKVDIPWHRQRLLEASDGSLWVAGWGQEAARLDYGSTRWTTYEGMDFQAISGTQICPKSVL